MRAIKGELSGELANLVGQEGVQKADAIRVDSYMSLMKYVAQLSYENRDHLIFFRGQNSDYRNKAGASTFYPSIYRGERITQEEISLRFDVLNSASRRLVDELARRSVVGAGDVKRRKYIQWSILQHYEVCATPLLDLTHSLRVACSFSVLKNTNEFSYVYIFGLPYITNRISINSEQDVVNVRLLSICPPDALRPYYQDGYMAGTDDVTSDYDSKDELDFNRRLIAKFAIPSGEKFWDMGFAPIPESAIYPSSDNMRNICDSIRHEVDVDAGTGQLGRFLQNWTAIETSLMNYARSNRGRVFTVREAINALDGDKRISDSFIEDLHDMRRTRNLAVHTPRKLKAGQLTSAINRMSELIRIIKELSDNQ